MMRCGLLLAALLALTSAAAGQDTKAPAEMPTPKGWGKETIALPPAFAADMKWKGSEELRFHPGMFKADSDGFFSYAILMSLPADAKTDAAALESELLTYYRGLCQAVLKSKNQTEDVSKFTLTLKEMRTPNRPGGEGCTGYTGEMRWVEPFTTGKPQTLRMEVQVWHCEKSNRRHVLVLASPQQPTAAMWKELRTIGDGIRCHPEAPGEKREK
jgi:hypothetical protein